MSKRIISLVLSFVLIFSMCPASVFAEEGFDNFAYTKVYEGQFRDVAETAWYAESVAMAYELDLVAGTGPTAFDPESNLKLSEVVTLAAQLHSRYYNRQIPAVSSGPWYQRYVDYAVSNGILFDSGFNFDRPATRAEYVWVLARCFPASGYAQINDIEDGEIPDVSMDEPYADAVYKFYRAGIMQGFEGGEFRPSSNIRRCEIAATLLRLADPSIRGEFSLKGEKDGNLSDKDALAALNEWIDIDEEGIKDDDGYLALKDWPELLEYMVDSAETMKEDGVIAEYEYSEEVAYIQYTLKSGLHVVYEPPIREYKDCAGSSVVTIEPCSKDNESKTPFSQYQGRVKNMQKKISDLGIGYTVGSSLLDDEVTIEKVKSSFENCFNGILLWFGHGQEPGPALKTGELYDEYKHKYLKKNEFSVSPSGVIFLRADWFRNHLKDDCLSGSLVILGACCSLEDDSIANALHDKGAECVIGSKKRIYIPKLFDTATALINGMTEKQSDGRYPTVSDAMKTVEYKVVGMSDVFEGKLEVRFDKDWRLYNTVSGNLSISGTVVDKNTKQPLAGATVTCGNLSTTADTDGKFSFTGLSEYTTHQVKANCAKYEEGGDFVSPVEDTNNVTISLTPAGRINLHTDPSDVSYKLYETDGSRDAEAIVASGKPIRQNVSDTRSPYELSGLYDGREYLLSVSVNGYNPKNVFVKASLDPGETWVTLDPLPAQQPTQVTATVTDSKTGKPVSGASVTLLFASAAIGKGTTDGNGECTIIPVQNNSNIKIKVEKDGYETLTETLSIKTNASTGVLLQIDPYDGSVPEGFTPIYTVEEFNSLQGNEKVILMDDISDPKPFYVWSGVLDGNGHTISNITQYAYSESYGETAAGAYSSFPCGWIMENYGEIRSITFENVRLNPDEGEWRDLGLIGYNNKGGTIKDCYIKSGSITLQRSSEMLCDVGSFAGENKGTIENCINKATIDTRVYNDSNIGGIAGYSYGDIRSCLNMGDIVITFAGSDNSSVYGGVIGRNSINEGSLIECANMNVNLPDDNQIVGAYAYEMPQSCYSLTVNKEYDGNCLIQKVDESFIRRKWPKAFE